ncbi:N-acetylglucosamine-6-phosphate deacetylase [Kribbella antibiotica]|uniref:N-acetylglucosamine-6-phosphate deacetylase n=1 Tax=Kribbella antibiotica TaxID=190195 RepID=A0A4R4YM70_9ACTN|nr:amidohydrolase family protein [Kribbella antibiotica]TDD45304.1 N-acetylglucosamine-6-phosphate deacetylase [Kribbella antibiotica]
MTTFIGARLVVDEGVVDDHALVIRDGLIEAIIPANAVAAGDEVHDLTGYTIVPGLIDLHVHGGGGYSFDDPDPAAHQQVIDFHARHGVTTMQASLVSALPADLDRQLDALALSTGDALHGVHLEGPYLAVSQCGAHNPAALRPPTPDEADRLLGRNGLITMVTVAPELPGVPEFTRRLTSAGVVVAAGHSEARAPELNAAVDNGLTHLTHLWSCQSALVREGPWRLPGLIEESLASTHLVGEIIADGHHLPATLIEIARRCLGDRLVAVSDATAGAGMPEGFRYRLGVIDCEVASGVGMVVGANAFGGSTTPLDGMLAHLHQALGWPLPEAVAATSTRPARVLNLADRKGRLTPGHDADLAVLSPDLTVGATMRAGRWIHNALG